MHDAVTDSIEWHGDLSEHAHTTLPQPYGLVCNHDEDNCKNSQHTRTAQTRKITANILHTKRN
jgi:hypothetical protein